MSARSRLLLVATVMGMAGTAVPAGAGVANRTLALPDLPTRQVEVPFGRNADKTVREGAVTLVVRNRTNARRAVRIRYAPKARQWFTVVADGHSRIDSVDDRGIAGRWGMAVTVPQRDIATLSVTFTGKDPNTTPEQAAGRFIVTAERPKSHRIVGGPLVIAVSGVRAEERSVTIAPESVTLPLTLNQPQARWPELREPLKIDQRSHGEAFVDLRGPGAAALSGNGSTEIQTVLRREDGESVQVTLGITSLPDNVAQLVLPRGDLEISEPGKYIGTLPLGSGESAPSVELVVEAKEWWGWAVLAVVIGVVLGRMVPPFLRRERVRRRGRDAIADAIRLYGTARRGRAEAASYDLDWLIAPGRWQLGGVFSRPQDAPALLLRDLTEQPSGELLDSAVNNARGLRTRVERWAQVERAARDLLGELEGRAARRGRRLPTDSYVGADDAYEYVPEDYVGTWSVVGAAVAAFAATVAIFDFGSLTWIVVTAILALVIAVAVDTLATRRRERRPRQFSTMVKTDAYRVLDALGEEVEVVDEAHPSDDEKQELKKGAERCLRADRERRLVRLATELWRRHDRLDGRRLPTEATQARAELEIENLWPVKAPASPDAPLDELDPELRDVSTFRTLSRKLQRANDDLKTLQRRYPPFGNPSAALLRTALDRVVAYGLWVVEALWRSVTRLVVALIRAVLSVPVWIARRILGLGRGWFAVAQTFSLLLTLSVPVIVYILTLYSDTWGSPLDVLTAFAAGFAGKIALDFGTTVRLPQFGSRQPATDAGSPPDVVEAAPASPPSGPNGDTAGAPGTAGAATS